MNENTTTTTTATEFYAQNSITGLFFNGTDFSDQKPSKAFDRTEIAFIKAAWSNVDAPVESVPHYINQVTDMGVTSPLSRSIRVF
jgi:hypothetical protein